MPILNTDILYRLSGGAGNSAPAASLGGAKSSATVASTDLFDDVASGEASAGDTEYRCIYVHNNHGSLTMETAKIWVQANTPSADTTIDIGLGTSAINGTEQTVANENTAPSGVSFSAPSVEGSALSLGNIPFGQHKAVWVRRTVNASASAAASDTFTLRVKCDTAA
jgi:hypothetical protein